MNTAHVSTVFLLLLIVSGAVPRVRPTMAQGTIHIRADGSVDPSSAPIQRSGDNYTLTGNINASIVVEKDNILIEGAGHTLQGDGSGAGINLSGRTNVTVQNAEIKSFCNGTRLNFSNNNKILRNILKDNTGYAIQFDRFNECNDNTIAYNNITNSGGGIMLSPSADHTNITGNIIDANNYDGIRLYASANTMLSGNKVTANRGYGIRIPSSPNSTLINNNMTGNYENLRIDAWSLETFMSLSIDTSNTVDGRPVYYWTNRRDADAPSDAGYLALINCSNITVKGLNLTNNGEGVLLANTENCTITQNNIAENEVGVHFYENSNNNTITYNNIRDNVDGVIIEESLANRVDHNNVTNDTIEFSFSSNNSVCWNNMTDSFIGLHVSANSNVSYNQLSGGAMVFFSTYDTVVSYNRVEAHDQRQSGLNIDSSSNNSIVYNDIQGYYTGIELKYSCCGNNISQNRIMDVGDCFEFSYSSAGNIVTGNDVWCRGWFAMLSYDSSGNFFYHNNVYAYTQPLEVFPSGLNYWDDGYPSGGNYWNNYVGSDVHRGMFQEADGSDGVGDMPMTLGNGNVDPYPLMKPYGGPCDIGVRFWTSKTVVPIGYNRTVTANVTVINYGEHIEMFGFEAQVGRDHMEQTLIVGARDSTQFTFTMNVTDWTMSNYTLYAEASQVSGETDLSDNTFSGHLTVTYLGDVNGDGRVNMKDVGCAARRDGADPVSLLWDPNADFNDDQKIDMTDIAMSAQQFGVGWR